MKISRVSHPHLYQCCMLLAAYQTDLSLPEDESKVRFEIPLRGSENIAYAERALSEISGTMRRALAIGDPGVQANIAALSADLKLADILLHRAYDEMLPEPEPML